jgi:tRNA (guanine37-N1)-methyltransferase
MSLKEDLSGVIPPDKLCLLGFWDLVGDVAIISLPPQLDQYKADASEAILSRRKNVKAVLNKLSKVEGDGRVPRYEILKGENTIATYREFGFTYRFDVTKVFFNRHLSYERHRIACAVVPGETVLVPFAGVGPFAIPLAARGCRVIAVEKNAEACKWLSSNARLNGVERFLDILNADAVTMPSTLNATFDRAVLPAPYGMDGILETLSPMVRKGGMLHYYTFKKKYQVEGLIRQFEGMGLKVEHYRRCGNVAPGVNRWAFDLKK